jgi:hypothetical protein
MGLRIFITIVLLLAICPCIQAQYAARIFNLNTKRYIAIQKGEKFYYQLKGAKTSIYATYQGATQDALLFDGKKIDPEQISWLSRYYFKNSLFSKWRQNSTVDLKVLPKPSYDLEEKYVLDIIPDTVAWKH